MPEFWLSARQLLGQNTKGIVLKNSLLFLSFFILFQNFRRKTVIGESKSRRKPEEFKLKALRTFIVDKS